MSSASSLATRSRSASWWPSTGVVVAAAIVDHETKSAPIPGGVAQWWATLIMGFIDTMRAEGHAVESICRVLREQGCQIAARTYRSWKRAGWVVAARTASDTQVVDAVRDIAWTDKADADGVLVRKMNPEGLYGRRKMTAYVRRTAIGDASFGSVDRAMRTLGLSGVRRDKGIRTRIPAKDGTRVGDLHGS